MKYILLFFTFLFLGNSLHFLAAKAVDAEIRGDEKIWGKSLIDRRGAMGFDELWITDAKTKKITKLLNVQALEFRSSPDGNLIMLFTGNEVLGSGLGTVIPVGGIVWDSTLEIRLKSLHGLMLVARQRMPSIRNGDGWLEHTPPPYKIRVL